VINDVQMAGCSGGGQRSARRLESSWRVAVAAISDRRAGWEDAAAVYARFA